MNEYKQIRELFGESREERKYIAQYERQQEVEEDLFTRATRTKEDKKREKRLKLRSGYVGALVGNFFKCLIFWLIFMWETLMFSWIRLDGLTENFNDEFKFLDNDDDQPGSFSGSGRNRGGGFKKRKVLFIFKFTLSVSSVF